MELKKYKLSEVAKVEISSVDKKIKENETSVRLCNFTDVYHNWAVIKEMVNSFMEASANASEIEKFTIKKGQVAFTKDSETRDDIGIPAYIADDFKDVLLGYHCALITPDKNKLSGKYLNAFMHSAYIQKYFENSASGSGQRYTLSLETLENMPLLLPSLEEQQVIGDLFSSIDRKISFNRSINRDLEALAKQIYDYWFVQFDFPDENGRPYKSSGGMMVWNDDLKREIPSSWNVKSIADIAEVYNGATPSTTDEENYGGDVVWITPKDLSTQQQKFIYHGERNISHKGYESCSTHLLPSNTVLMSSRAPIGLLAIAKTELCTNQGFKSFVPRNDNEATYLYYYIQTHIRQIEQLGTGTTFKEVSREDVLKFPILKPNNGLLDTWEVRISAINKKQLEIQKENENLTKLRNELLPLLMNGQVTVNPDLSVC